MRQGEQDAAAADGLKAGLSAAREQNARGAQLVVFDRDGGVPRALATASLAAKDPAAVCAPFSAMAARSAGV